MATFYKEGILPEMLKETFSKDNVVDNEIVAVGQGQLPVPFLPEPHDGATTATSGDGPNSFTVT